jgi:uncharacterized protein (DUF983 family)
MYERCSACDERFEREPGQSLGAVYINMALSVAAALALYLLTSAATRWPDGRRLMLASIAAAIGPVAFFRLAKGIWTGLIFLGEGLYIDWPQR